MALIFRHTHLKTRRKEKVIAIVQNTSNPYRSSTRVKM